MGKHLRRRPLVESLESRALLSGASQFPGLAPAVDKELATFKIIEFRLSDLTRKLVLANATSTSNASTPGVKFLERVMLTKLRELGANGQVLQPRIHEVNLRFDPGVLRGTLNSPASVRAYRIFTQKVIKAENNVLKVLNEVGQTVPNKFVGGTPRRNQEAAHAKALTGGISEIIKLESQMASLYKAAAELQTMPNTPAPSTI